MKVLKWSKINAIDGSGSLKEVERKRTITKYGKYVVDDSKFVPMSELVKRNVESGNTTMTNREIKGYFDYPEGYKNGKSKEVDVSTRLNRDIGEVSKNLHDKEVKVKAELEKQIRINEKIKRFNEKTKVEDKEIKK